MTERQPLLSTGSSSTVGGNATSEATTIINLMTKTHVDISHFERHVKDYGTVKDTDKFRHLMHQRKLEISESLKRIAEALKQPSFKNKIQKIQLDKLLKNLKDDTSKFEQLIQFSQQKEHSHQPINDMEFRNSLVESPFGSSYGGSNQFKSMNQQQQQQGYQSDYIEEDDEYGQSRQQQQQQQEQEQKYQTLGLGGQFIDQDQIYNEIIEERNKASKQLVEDIQVLREVMGDISGIVNEGGEQLAIASDNVQQADKQVEEAVEDLEKAMVYKSSYRRKMFILVLCLLITMVGVGIFLGIYFGLIKKK